MGDGVENLRREERKGGGGGGGGEGDGGWLRMVNWEFISNTSREYVNDASNQVCM